MQSYLVRVRGLFLIFLLLVSSLAACAALKTQQQMPLSPVPITEIKAVEGTWEGLVTHARTGKDSGRVVVVLTFHDAYGTYSFRGSNGRGSSRGDRKGDPAEWATVIRDGATGC
jgi:hypothetical protein